MKKLSVTLIPLLGLAFSACTTPPQGEGEGEGGGEGEGEGVACPLSADALALLTESVNEAFQAGIFATTQTHGGALVDLGFASDLIGLDAQVHQIATLAFPCTAPSTFDPTCAGAAEPGGGEPADPFLTDHDRCFRLGCVDADKPFVDVYYTMKPHTAADDRHAFSVDTTSPIGSASYAANPLVRWVADLSAAGSVGTHADIDLAPVVTTASETIDVSSVGTVDGSYVTATPDDLVTIALVLHYPRIAASEIVVEASGDAAGALTGGVTQGTRVLATLSGTVDPNGGPLPFVWIDSCAP